MKGNILGGIVIALLLMSLFASKPLHAQPAAVCQSTQLTGILLGMCDVYVTEESCMEAQNHGSHRCKAIRDGFFVKSAGLDLDELLAQAGTSIRVVIPSTGGPVTLPGIGSVTFPADAFEDDTVVEIAVEQSPAVDEVFGEFASIFRPSTRLTYEVVVSTGALPPLSEAVGVQLNLPADFVAEVPSGYGIEFFAMVEQASDLDLPFRSFELFESYLTPTGDAITASVPGGAFFRDADGSYKAVFTLAPTPGEKIPLEILRNSALAQLQSSSLSTSECKAASITCPVSGGCEVTSPYNKARKHPVTGETRPHYGVDYRAPTGTPLVAAAGGTVERSYTSSSFGETIVLRHDDGGATLYAHLQQRNVQVGDVVGQGQGIGTANNTGLSSGPHLHLEYVPNGQIIQSKSRIDPDACIDAEGSGSVTVSDSGSEADDAFGVLIDGFFIGQTAVGATNTLAVSNLRVGEHRLTLDVLVAPDNAGTYTVQLNDGLLFTDGSASKTGTAGAGAQLSWQFVVP